LVDQRRQHRGDGATQRDPVEGLAVQVGHHGNHVERDAPVARISEPSDLVGPKELIGGSVQHTKFLSFPVLAVASEYSHDLANRLPDLGR
jgi:hypothetical protein